MKPHDPSIVVCKLGDKKLRSEEILVWYDGPLMEVLRDADGNYYLTYIDVGVSAVLAQVPKELLISVLKNEIPISDAFHKAIRKFEWDDGGACKYVEVEKFCDEDLLDPDVYFREIPGCNEKEYIASLENRR